MAEWLAIHEKQRCIHTFIYLLNNPENNTDCASEGVRVIFP